MDAKVIIEQPSKPRSQPLRDYGIDYRVDPTVSFAEFTYWAKIERKEEAEAERLFLERRGPMTVKKMVKSRFSKGVHHENEKLDERDRQLATGTIPSTEGAANGDSSSDLAEEWKTASRAMRTAGWSSVFFLITTDILGWSGCPYVNYTELRGCSESNNLVLFSQLSATVLVWLCTSSSALLLLAVVTCCGRCLSRWTPRAIQS